MEGFEPFFNNRLYARMNCLNGRFLISINVLFPPTLRKDLI